VALVPGAGPWSVLRSLRVLRVLRLLTVVPALRKVVAAFLHSIPGLAGVVAVMAIFFYTAGVLATRLFGGNFPDWFGSLGKSLYTLFQIMTLESWSMGIVRPVMESHPMAWAFFVPFIVIATFTILNLFIGIIVSTMQELSMLPDKNHPEPELAALLERMEADLKVLRATVERLRDKSP
jgi:voltage-gated sodium channel